jgi:hypothetical protein
VRYFVVEYANSMSERSIIESLDTPDVSPESHVRSKHMSEHHEQHAHTDHAAEWKKQGDMFKTIEKMGMQKYVEMIKGMEEAFELEDHCVHCIDEGTPGGIHAAGSGILMEESQAIEAMKKAKADGVWSHAGCGAAALYAKREGLDMTNPDEYGIVFAKHLAEKLGVPYKGHIESKDMARPADMHNARVAYYDGTGSFDPSRVPDLPPGFVISRRYLEPEYAAQEADVSVSIATGDHGYGNLITSDEPFYIIPVGDPEDPNFSVEKLSAELKELVLKSGGRVKVMGFTKPATQEGLEEAA